MNQSKNIKELSEFCNKVGKDFFLVQGVGGNVSYKSNDKLIIKASGVSLKDALNNNIFVNGKLPGYTSQQTGEYVKLEDKLNFCSHSYFMENPSLSGQGTLSKFKTA